MSALSPFSVTPFDPNMHNRFDECSKNIQICSQCKPTIESVTEDSTEQRIVNLLDRKTLSLEENLHLACQEGDLYSASYFLARGASVHTLINGISPLFYACQKENAQIVELLLKNGASASQKNDLSYKALNDKYWKINDHMGLHGATPMKAAIVSRNRYIVKLILRFKAPLDEPIYLGRTPLFVAIQTKNERLALFFILKGAKLNVQDHTGHSIMSAAVSCGLLRIVQELINRCVSVKDVRTDGATLLHDAIFEPAVLSLLLQHGAKEVINKRSDDRWTALALAVDAGVLKSISILIKAGADLSLRYGSFDIVELAKRKLFELEYSYKRYPEFHDTKAQDIANRKAIIELLEQAMNSPIRSAL
jgi:ankyrin repeat protein